MPNLQAEARAHEAAVSSIRSYQNALSEIKSDYYAAKETRFQPRLNTIVSYGIGADYHYHSENDYYYMGELSRHIARNDQVVAQGIETLVKNVVQGGFTLKPETGSDATDRALKERWQRYSSDKRLLDKRSKFNWLSHEQIGLREVIVWGDFLINPLRDGRIQQFEGHRLRSPSRFLRSKSQRVSLMHGVQMYDERPTRYWVTKRDYDGVNYFSSFGANDVLPIPAWQFDPLTQAEEEAAFHVFHPRRFSQSRGITKLAPIAQTTGMHDDAQFATLVQRQLVSYIGLIHEIPTAAWEDYENAPPGEEADDPKRSGVTQNYTPMGPASEYWPRYAGEKITAFSGAVPSEGFFEHSRMLLTFIGVSLALPLILLLMDGKETNFSGWRGAMDQAKLKFKDFQLWYSQAFHKPVFHWQVRRWIRQDAELRRAFDRDPFALFNHSWGFPRWPYIEPMKDVLADVTEIGHNLISPRRAAARRSLNYEEIVDESCKDRELLFECAMDAAQRLNQHEFVRENPEQAVSWREIAFPPDASQLQLLDTRALDPSGDTPAESSQDLVEK